MIFDEAALEAVVERAVRRVLAERKPENVYLSVADAAKLAAVTPTTIRAWVKMGRLNRYRAGREIRVRQDELEAVMTAPIKENTVLGGETPEQRGERLFEERRARRLALVGSKR